MRGFVGLLTQEGHYKQCAAHGWKLEQIKQDWRTEYAADYTGPDFTYPG